MPHDEMIEKANADWEFFLWLCQQESESREAIEDEQAWSRGE